MKTLIEKLKHETGRGWLARLGRIFNRGAEVFVWLHKFVIKNVFFIEREGGPMCYLLCLIVLPLLPLWAASCAIGEMLIAIDDEIQ